MLEAVSKAVAKATFAHGPRGLGRVDGVDALAYVLCAWVAVVFGVLDLHIDGNPVEAYTAQAVAGNVDNVVARLDFGASIASASPRASVTCAVGLSTTRTPSDNGKNSENLFHGADCASKIS